MESKRFKEIAQIHGNNSIQATQITEYIPVEEAQEKEGDLVNEYKNKGFIILNKMKT